MTVTMPDSTSIRTGITESRTVPRTRKMRLSLPFAFTFTVKIEILMLLLLLLLLENIASIPFTVPEHHLLPLRLAHPLLPISLPFTFTSISFFILHLSLPLSTVASFFFPLPLILPLSLLSFSLLPLPLTQNDINIHPRPSQDLPPISSPRTTRTTNHPR